MTPEEFLERAEHYRAAKESARNDFARHHLEALEHSYRVLAASETAVRKAARTAKALSRTDD